MHCHNCEKNFIAELDYDIQGNHVIICPHCGHEHWRTIKKGKITDFRWGSHNDGNTPTTQCRRVWSHDHLKMKTSSAAEHIRDQFLRHRWLNRSDSQ